MQNSPSIVTTYQMYGREEFHVRKFLREGQMCLTWEICMGACSLKELYAVLSDELETHTIDDSK